jgi:hypothetical protein
LQSHAPAYPKAPSRSLAYRLFLFLLPFITTPLKRFESVLNSVMACLKLSCTHVSLPPYWSPLGHWQGQSLVFPRDKKE